MSDVKLKERDDIGLSTNISEEERELVVFKLDREEFGVSIEHVKEIVKLPEITLIPLSSDYVVGICNLRGKVLPVVDARIRFSLDRKDATKQTRLLVVDIGSETIGLIVDEVSQVLSISSNDIEPPPESISGIGKEYLEGVVKLDEGKRLVLLLNLKEAFNSKDNSTDKKRKDLVETKDTEKDNMINKSIDEEQLVSFILAEEEYAFTINKVREILRVTEITKVPNVPDYVRGLLTIRGQLLPVLDLRTMLKVDAIGGELNKTLDDIKNEHNAWADELRKSIEEKDEFTGQKDPNKCSLGIWIYNFKSPNNSLNALIGKVKTTHEKFHESADIVLKLAEKSKEEAAAYFEEKIIALKDAVINDFTQLIENLDAAVKDNQRILVIEADGITVGLIVDHVNEVVRIPKNIIDKSPSIASSDDKELRGVAKLDKGKRLIMIMDESALISGGDSKTISRMTKGGSMQNKNIDADKELDEEQFVTFSIGDEEYGIQIIKVQEINRLTEITKVPKAPYFIEGVTNLRGNVIPVIDIRKRFSMDTKAADDKTRIIVVDIEGKRTGLKVDMVNEVLRLLKSEIESSPAIVSSDIDSDFIESIGKIDDGSRMIIILNIEKILTAREKQEFKKVDISKDADSLNPKKDDLNTSLPDVAAEPEAKSKQEITGSDNSKKVKAKASKKSK